jgi:hypothetical protein
MCRVAACTKPVPVMAGGMCLGGRAEGWTDWSTEGWSDKQFGEGQGMADGPGQGLWGESLWIHLTQPPAFACLTGCLSVHPFAVQESLLVQRRAAGF